MNLRRIGLLVDGDPASVGSAGSAIAEALCAAGHDVETIPLERGSPGAEAISMAGIDLAFLARHERPEQDGCIQGLLECLAIPYTGPSPLCSALARDKLKAKELFRLHNVPTPPYYLVKGPRDRSEIQEIHGAFGFPVLVHPRRARFENAVSAIGSIDELVSAVAWGISADDSVVVERKIRGSEIQVAILAGRVLGAIEVDRGDSTAVGLAWKVHEPQYFMPARLGVQRTAGVLNLAERAAEALGVDGAVLVRLVVSEGQNEYVLEVDPQPLLAPGSPLVRIAAAAGFGFPDLCTAILQRARLWHVEPEARQQRAERFVTQGPQGREPRDREGLRSRGDRGIDSALAPADLELTTAAHCRAESHTRDTDYRPWRRVS